MVSQKKGESDEDFQKRRKQYNKDHYKHTKAAKAAAMNNNPNNNHNPGVAAAPPGTPITEMTTEQLLNHRVDLFEEELAFRDRMNPQGHVVSEAAATPSGAAIGFRKAAAPAEISFPEAAAPATQSHATIAQFYTYEEIDNKQKEVAATTKDCEHLHAHGEHLRALGEALMERGEAWNEQLEALKEHGKALKEHRVDMTWAISRRIQRENELSAHGEHLRVHGEALMEHGEAWNEQLEALKEHGKALKEHKVEMAWYISRGMQRENERSAMLAAKARHQGESQL